MFSTNDNNQPSLNLRYDEIFSLSLEPNDKYCCAEGDCGRMEFGQPISCSRFLAREWELFCPVLPFPKFDNQDIDDLYIQNQYSQYNEEISSRYLQDNVVIGIRSYNWNAYLSVEEDDNHIVHSNRQKLQSWEYLVFYKYPFLNISHNIIINTTNRRFIRDMDQVYIYSRKWEKWCGVVDNHFFNQLFCYFSLNNATLFYVHYQPSNKKCDFKENISPLYSSQEDMIYDLLSQNNISQFYSNQSRSQDDSSAEKVEVDPINIILLWAIITIIGFMFSWIDPL